MSQNGTQNRQKWTPGPPLDPLRHRREPQGPHRVPKQPIWRHLGPIWAPKGSQKGAQNDAKKQLKNWLIFKMFLSTSWGANGLEKWPKYGPKSTLKLHILQALFQELFFSLKNDNFALIIPSVNLKSTRQGRRFLNVASFPPWRNSWRKMLKKTPEKRQKIGHECIEKTIRNRARILGIILAHFWPFWGPIWGPKWPQKHH